MAFIKNKNCLTIIAPNIKTVKHGFFTRIGGVSSGPFESLNCSYSCGDNITHVKKNRIIVTSYMSVNEKNLIVPNQSHGNKVEEVTQKNINNTFESDSLISKNPGILLGILTADCAPLLLADPISGYVASVHVGWRGAVKGIIENTIKKMSTVGVNTRNIIAAIGPTIGPESFEVGPEVLSLFSSTKTGAKKFFIKKSKKKLICNLSGWIKADLNRLSVKNIWNSKLDTMKDSSVYFSHRNSIANNLPYSGRMISVIQPPLL